VHYGVARLERDDGRKTDFRFLMLTVGVCVLFAVMGLRLAKLQIADRQMYQLLASDQHDLQSRLMPTRGRILIRDRTDGKAYPLAANRDSWTLYAVPKDMDDPVKTAHELAPVLGMPDVDLVTKLTAKKDDPYEVLVKDAPIDLIKRFREQPMRGIGYSRQPARLYPEPGMGGQVIGLVTPDDKGQLTGRYGVENAFQEVLAGKPGMLEGEKDAQGRRLVFATNNLREAVNGADVVLTLDRSIQFQACEHVKQGVLEYAADGGSIVVMEPQTGAVLAMCSYPDFDPANLKEISDVGVFNNPVTFVSYEPGSIFKGITMAAGVDAGKVGPKTTYVDKGEENIDDHTIRNSDLKAHGVQTMTQVLELSLNTGSIFVQRQLGKKSFREYVKAFGFGQKTGIGLTPESAGDISPLDRKGDVFAATASYGQGITVTPLQMTSAFAALANQGTLMRPNIVAETIYPDGRTVKTEPEKVGQPISARAAHVVSGMLVSVIENGHGQKAGVPGYWVAGKTGTAQVPKKNGPGYEDGKVIASLIGFAPADNPKFVMLVKFDNPRKAQWAESCAAPVWGDMAKFLLQYLGVKPNR